MENVQILLIMTASLEIKQGRSNYIGITTEMHVF
jgi:hypothetical protein